MLDLTKFEGHTPGPWVADCNQFGTMPVSSTIVRSGEDGDNGVSGRNGIMVVGVGDCGWDDCQGAPGLSYNANARLIAAAPDLLAEVKRLRSLCDELACDLGKLSDQLAATNGGAA